ncbi:glycosyltransferase [Lacinutrix salivirga]
MENKLLIIGFVWPEPKSSAAGSRMMQLIRFFQSQNYSITFASPCSKSDNAFNLETIGVTQKTIELNHPSFDTFIKTLQPTVVLFDRFMMEEQFGWRVAEHCPNALRILDTEDLQCLRKGRHQAYKENTTFNPSYLFSDLAKREIASIYRCDLSLIISEEEQNLLITQFKVPQTLLLYIPFLMPSVSAETKRLLPNFENRSHFVTIGNFLHAPNYDSVLYLKSTIWPLLQNQLPKAELHIYGSYSSQKIEQLHNPKEGFFIKGFAENVNTVMQNAKICLAPLQFGAGLKGKFFDAMQNGTPCITTTIGAEGIFGTMEPNGFVTDNPNDIVSNAMALYNDKALWQTKQKKGFEVLEKRFNASDFKEEFKLKLEEVLKNIQHHRNSNFTGQLLMHHTLQSTKYMSKWIEAKNKD